MDNVPYKVTIIDNDTGELVEEWETWGFDASQKKFKSDIYPHVTLVFPVFEEE